MKPRPRLSEIDANHVDKTESATFILGGGETGALIRRRDWNKTPLGPARNWPQSLRTAINICVSSRFPIALYWGPEYVMLYNDDLIPMVGANKHPHALGQPAFEVLPEIRTIIEPLLERVVSTGEAIWSEDLMLPLFRNDAQTESYFTFTYSPIHDESGAVGGVFCAVLETTDKIIEERRLRLLNALSETTGAKTPDDACKLAAEQLARASNDVPFALLYLLDDTGSRLHLAGTANIEPGGAWAPTSIAVGDHSTWPFEMTSAPGARRRAVAGGPASANGAVILPIERAAGAAQLGFLVAGLSALLRSSESYDRFHRLLAASISQGVSNAAVYAAERQRAEALAKLDRAKTIFFSNVSHEFRTPLTLMLAPIQDMLIAPAGAVIDAAAVKLLHRNALRLLKLVNTLLEFSRIESGRIEVAFEPVDLATLTTDLASNFRAAIERAGLALIVDCPPLSEAAYVDRDMWEKIVLNLLSNALKFTFEGTITVRLRPDARTIRLEVEDTGTGISNEELPHLFERFHRIEGARSRSHEGSGIGLALVHELTKVHGGRIDVTSQLGVGTRFTMRIPRGAGHLPADRVRAPRKLQSTAGGAEAFICEAMGWASQAQAAPESGLREAASGARILFADDNADMREYVARLLGERWNLELARDGNEALLAIRHRPPDLVLCDAMMPGLDGFALVQAIRADEALRALPVIMLSARAGEEDAEKGLSAGANDYIAKPFSARDLLVRVATNLAAAEAAKEARARERTQRADLYRHFMQASFPVCVLKGAEHEVEIANPSMLSAWGKGPAVIGRALALAVPELRGQPFLGYLDEVYRTGVAHEGRAELAYLPSRSDGELRAVYFHFVYAPLRTPNGETEGVLVSAFDVTENVNAQRKTDEVAQTQRALLEFQERFVAVLGHDLRNPINAINMAAGLLDQLDLADPAARATHARTVSRITSSARRMALMVEQLMELSRSRVGGGFVITPTQVDLGSMLTDIVDELKTSRPARVIEIVSPVVQGRWDRDRLEQVFSNLIGNALQHGRASAPITIRVSEDRDSVHVDVHNEGTPIPDTLLATLFEPFRRGARISHENAAGLGLGLYISRQLVLAHGGDISVSSDAAHGTTFRVTLPRTTTPR